MNVGAYISIEIEFHSIEGWNSICVALRWGEANDKISARFSVLIHFSLESLQFFWDYH